jgi:hypothetical protein
MQDDDSDPRERGRSDFVEILRDLAVLRDRGVLNEPEFQRAKAKLFTQYLWTRESPHGKES